MIRLWFTRRRYTDAEAVAAAGVPSGIIALWHGTIVNIPSGWVICDGNNSTPDLLTKFVEGVATAATDPGATGGATAKTTGGHQHTFPIWASTNFYNDFDEYGSGDSFSYDKGPGAQAASPGDGDGSLTKTQTDGITDIRPLYYDIAFIMKT